MIKILRIKSYHFYVPKIIVNYNVFDRVLSNIFLSENGISNPKPPPEHNSGFRNIFESYFVIINVVTA